MPAGADLYVLNAGRRQVASSYPMTTYSGMQPIRNAEANNVALQLLGLGPIPGSSFNYAQNLVVVLPTPKPSITRISGPTNGVFTVSGSADQTGKVVLWKATSLAAPVWARIQTNNVSSGVPFSFSVPQEADSQAFFRMMGQ